MGKKGFFATLFVILLLVFFLFPTSTGKEFFLVPKRIIDLSSVDESDFVNESGKISFALGDYFGYFTDEMELTYSNKIDYRVTISDNTFINYPKIPSILDVQDMSGQGRSIIETSGYPIIADDRVFILSDSFISLYNLDGNLFWKKEILSFVTSLSLSRDFVLIGYLDGLCELISVTGEVLLSYRPGGSRIESIYSAAISGDGQTLAIISGLDPQRFIVLQNRKDEYKPVHHFELDHQYRRTINMYFSSDDNRVFFENPRGVNVYDTLTQELVSVGGAGRLEKIFIDEEDGFFSLLLKQVSRGDLKILTPENRRVIERSFPGDKFFFRKMGSNYYLGSGNRLMYLKMVNN